MANTKVTTKEIRSNEFLDHLADEATYNAGTPVDHTELDDLLRSINAELTPPLRFNIDPLNSRKLNVEAIEILNPETGNIRTLTPIDGVVPIFTSGTIEIPMTSGGNILISPGSAVALTITAGLYRKIILRFDKLGNLGVAIGAEAATEALAPLPNIKAALGYIVVRHDTGTSTLILEKAIKFDTFDPGIQVQYDGADLLKRSVINFLGSEVSVSDDGNRINVTIGTDEPAKIVDDNGDLKVKLRPKLDSFTLQSPDMTLWEVTISNLGVLAATSGSLNPMINPKVLRDDLTEVGIIITNAGQLQTEVPPNGLALLESNGLYIASPDGTAWKINVNNSDIIYTSTAETAINSFTICSDTDVPLFKVREIANTALIYMPVVNAATLLLMTPPPSVAGMVPEVYYDAGAGIKKIFFDTGAGIWKYTHDNSAV